MVRRISVVAALVVAVLAATACGSGRQQAKQATLILDFTPNAVHSGIYRALHDGLYKDDGVNLRVREPSSSSDSLKLLEAGRADFAIADIHDIGIARERGLDIVGVSAIVETPLASVLTLKKSGITNPSQLVGGRVGVTGLPSDDAVLDSIVKNSGADPNDVKRVTIGFNAVAGLIAGKVDGATGFWNAEGVTLESKGHPVQEFRVDEYGAPSYPELVIVVSRETVEKDPGLIKSVVTATNKGYDLTLESPKKSINALLGETKGLDRNTEEGQLRALMPVIKGKAKSVGYLDPKVLREWGQWDVKFGILKRHPDIDKAFTNRFQKPG